MHLIRILIEGVIVAFGFFILLLCLVALVG